MIKTLLWTAIGAAGALELDRWWEGKRDQLTPRAVTGAMLEKINRRLEEKRGASSSSR